MDQPPSKRLKLDAAGAAVGSATTPATAAAAAAMGDGIALMLLDIQETAGGAMQLWGKTPKGQTVLVHVPDFEPYFYVPAPLRAPTAAGPQRGEWSEEEEDPTAAGSDQELQQQDLEQLKHLVNCRWGSDVGWIGRQGVSSTQTPAHGPGFTPAAASVVCCTDTIAACKASHARLHTSQPYRCLLPCHQQWTALATCSLWLHSHPPRHHT